MKTFINVLFLISLLIYAQNSNSQSPKNKKKTIYISFDKPCILIFEDAIKENYLGLDSLDITTSVKTNKYLIAATQKKGFPETSLFIGLNNGLFYDFNIKYKSIIDTTVFQFSSTQASGRDPFASEAVSGIDHTLEGNKGSQSVQKQGPVSSEIINDAQLALQSPSNIKDKAVVGKKLQFYLESIYVKNDKLFLKLSAKNQSNIAYDIHSIEFNIIPVEGLLKKAAGDAQPKIPIFVLNGDKNTINRKSVISKIFVFDKFTLSEKKLDIKILEGNGGDRQLIFSVTEQDLLKAKNLEN